jgi:Heterokaryon incompatibility protein (HET)
MATNSTRSNTRRFLSWAWKRGNYEYQPLPNATSFRVLELLPGQADEKIKFRLLVADWLSPPKYEAISYTWGDTKDIVLCKCDGKAVYIASNLHNALRTFRYPDNPRVLWADAVWYVY